ncbi:MAG TPA: adenylate/guanylate cyclase domain-containing protein, partial [Spirochaetota bacterium]|nr:adenylate/guanylate cyclase domain-containing protein [Spirochaetota bacterium]
DVLKHSTKKFDGAIIKTIGDAIMAAFSKPSDAIQSAIDMIEQIENYNNSSSNGNPISIKIGLNSGNALAVTANDMLDYFGQNVNIAARVQGLAGSQEIWFTENIYNDEIISILKNSSYDIERKSALLKGISEPTVVYKSFSNI